MNVHELMGASQRAILDDMVDKLRDTVHAYDGLLNVASVIGALECLKLEIIQEMMEDDEEEAD